VTMIYNDVLFISVMSGHITDKARDSINTRSARHMKHIQSSSVCRHLDKRKKNNPL